LLHSTPLDRVQLQRANMVPVGASFTATGVGGILPPSAPMVTTPKVPRAFHQVGSTGDGVTWPQTTIALASASGLVLAHATARRKQAKVCYRESVRRLLFEDPQPAQVEGLHETADKAVLPVMVKAREFGGKDGGRADAVRQGGMVGRARMELETLQGYWEELHTGMTIKVTNGEVDFHDGQDMRKFTEGAEGLSLKGAVLAGGLPDLAVWDKGDATGFMVWARAPHVEDDPTYAATFYKCKLHRTILRTKLLNALAAEDYKAAASIQEVWQSTWGAGENATPQKELRLAGGRFLVPGVCVRHKVFKFRAVVLGCEAWIRAPVLKMLTEAKSASLDTTLHRLQPVYWCLVDKRDAPGSGLSVALEKDLEIAPDIYPLQSPFVKDFLEAQDSIQGYLPGVRLKRAMKTQSVGLPFMLRNN